MSMPRYSAYKPSGVEWFGEVPSHWHVKRLKNEASYCVSNVDKVPSDDELPVRLCNYTDVYYNDRITPNMELMETTATAEEIRKFGLLVNDVLITKDSEEWSDIAVPAMVAETAPDLLCGYHLAIIRPTEGRLHGKYLLRVLQSSAVNQQFQIAASGVTRYGLPKSSIGEAWLPLPPLEEQQTIADYLDVQTTKIDTLLEKKRQFIGKLKEKRSALIARTVTRGLPPAAAKAAGLEPHPAMKDSGVEWIGVFPEHWGVSPLFRIVDSIQTGPFGTQLHQSDYIDDGIPLINPVHLVDGVLVPDAKNTVTIDTAERLARYRLKVGDVIFARRGDIGRCATVRDGQDGWLCGTGSMVVRFKTGLADYYSQIFSSAGFSSVLELNAVGTTMLNLNPSILGRMRVPIPPVDEQKIIVDYLDCETARIDQLTAKVEAALSRLTEYRQALITAAVTGKIDVSQYNTQKGAQHATVTLS